MSLRDWLIIIGVIIIAGILIDGYRRMRLARMDSLKMSRDMGGNIESTPLDDDFNPELPGGGARVVSPGVDSVDEDSEDQTQPSLDNSEETASVDSENPIVANREEFEAIDEPLTADVESRIGGEEKVVPTAHAGKKAEVEPPTSDPSLGNSNEDQEVLVINVDCKHGEGFSGSELKKLLEACGMNHGDMSIFHRHEEDDLLSPIQFSVANAVEPGYFDPALLDQLTTPGVSFFMSLPGPKDYMKAFDYMLETAQVFARNLDGELKDELRSVMTAQTIEHSRQRIREFERKQLSKARA